MIINNEQKIKEWEESWKITSIIILLLSVIPKLKYKNVGYGSKRFFKFFFKIFIISSITAKDWPKCQIYEITKQMSERRKIRPQVELSLKNPFWENEKKV